MFVVVDALGMEYCRCDKERNAVLIMEGLKKMRYAAAVKELEGEQTPSPSMPKKSKSCAYK